MNSCAISPIIARRTDVRSGRLGVVYLPRAGRAVTGADSAHTRFYEACWPFHNRTTRPSRASGNESIGSHLDGMVWIPLE